MALMEVDFYSQVLGLQNQAYVIIPQSESGVGVGQGGKKQGPYPVLWLLHGASDDHSIWLRRSSIERYVASFNLAVVMPNAHLSSYANMVHGQRYADFFSRELPAIMGEFFHLSARREDNYVAGLSMGGYGALALGLGNPEVFSAIGCFSAGNLNMRANRPPGQRKSGKASRDLTVFGVENRAELLGNPDYDCFAMGEAALASGFAQGKTQGSALGKPLPRIFHCCGTEDFLYENAKTTAAWFKAHPRFDYTFEEGPGGHTWEFWDCWVRRFLSWLTGTET
jgi:S-formylglutathione hydrolase FrmB